MGSDLIRLRSMLVNAFAAFVCFFFAGIQFIHFYSSGHSIRISHILLAIQQLILGILFVLRAPPRKTSWKLWDVTAAFLAYFVVFLFLPRPNGENLLGLFFQITGVALSIFALLSLGRSVALMPANRGIRTQGMYCFVRHPLYASYQILNLGYVLNNPSLYNVVVAIVGLLSQVLRIYTEERLLAEDPEYAAYQKLVRWRLVPFLF